MSERSQLLLFAVAGLLTGYLIGQGWHAGDVETARRKATTQSVADGVLHAMTSERVTSEWKR